MILLYINTLITGNLISGFVSDHSSIAWTKLQGNPEIKIDAPPFWDTPMALSSAKRQFASLAAGGDVSRASFSSAAPDSLDSLFE
jgi:hypothetical protein